VRLKGANVRSLALSIMSIGVKLIFTETTTPIHK
jgi:hypothetical protein